jgi:hypothetical protein
MPNRRDPDKHADQMRRGAKARNDARAELVRRHRAEYDAIYAELASANGVTPQPDKFKRAS